MAEYDFLKTYPGLTFHKSSAVTQPSEFDDTGSKYNIYFRKNFQQKEIHDEDEEESQMIWEYDEVVIPKDVYAQMQEELAADEQHTNDLLAMAELAETMESNKTELEMALADIAEMTLAMASA